MNDQTTLALYTCAAPDCGIELEYRGYGRPPRWCDTHYPSRAPRRKPLRSHEVPAARSSDPDTSREAAIRVAETAEKVEARIRASFAAFGWLTDDELCAVTEGLPATIKTARSRMKNRGEIVKTGQKRPSNTGSPMIVWKLAARA